MSVRSAAGHVDTKDASDPTMRLAFIGNVHRLLALGYRRLDAPKYHNADENLMTQDLTAALRKATQDVRNPRWTCWFSIHEKPKQNDEHLKGNSRLELDIVFERTQRGLHPHFVIEAKRLGPDHPIGEYLGPEGLGAFISCEYAREHDDAGMLGYVQSKTLDDWSSSLESRLATSPGKYSVEPTGTWQRYSFRGGPAMTYRSCHKRPTGRRPITIYHTLLDFNA
ncbi:MAG: hypothetical protein NTZ17_19650 [Phycisphaerae bacterium]|nr:hypothetical protein [Phycisphaerae bacterium]